MRITRRSQGTLGTCLAVLLLTVVGCVGPSDPPQDGGSGAPTTTSTTGSRDPLPGGPVAVHGAIRPHGDGWLVDVQAQNVGTRSIGYAQSFCIGSAWFARLSGPPGENLTYRDPQADQLGCPGFNDGVLEPGQWHNWTADPSCTTRYVCDNQWDGRLWSDGQEQQAPAGSYTWRFVFPYFDTPVMEGEDGTSEGPSARHTEEIVFMVEVD